MSNFIKSIFKKHSLLPYILVFCLVICVAIIRYPNYDFINYRCSDATWHTLLTMNALDETSISVHHFLPIVSLGQDSDKFISWSGSTVADDLGNYYYVSFSAGSFVVPYIFCKLFSLPFSESSLYLLNSILLLISSLFLVRLFTDLYISTYNKPLSPLLALLCIFFYITSPEILHITGIVWWAHSLFQTTFIIQLFCFSKIQAKQGRLLFKCIFFLLCILNPYIEWSGHVANLGFIVGTFFNQNILLKEKVRRVAFIIGCTFLSGVLFIGHYLSVLSPTAFFSVLSERFLSRSDSSGDIGYLDLFSGYLSSFGIALLLLLVLVVLIYLTRHKRSNRVFVWQHNIGLCVAFIFPVLENPLMLRHAVIYSYDRAKLGITLTLIFFSCTSYLWEEGLVPKMRRFFVAGLVVISFVSNFIVYVNNSDYLWNASYRESNSVIATYLQNNYDGHNSIIGSSVQVRGYSNLLFHRGIYEYTTFSETIELAKSHQKQYAIFLISSDTSFVDSWSMIKYYGAYIYDIKANKYFTLSLNENHIVLTQSDALPPSDTYNVSLF